MMPWFLVLFLAVVFGSASAEDEEGLYEPAPPPNAAFVRILHARPALDVVTARVGQMEYGSLRYTEASPYRVVLQGERQVVVSNFMNASLEVVAGSFYTVALIPDGDSGRLLIIADTANTSRARALVTLYNFTTIPAVDLKTSDAVTTVLQQVAPNSSSSLIVNPITVTLAAFAEEAVIGEVHEVRLERGAAYSVIVTGTPEAPQTTWVQSTTR